MARMGPWRAFSSIGHRFRAGMVKDYLNSYMKERDADALLVLKTDGKNLKLIVEAVEVGENCVVLQLKREKFEENGKVEDYVGGEKVDDGVGGEGRLEVDAGAIDEGVQEGCHGIEAGEPSISVICAAVPEGREHCESVKNIIQIGSCMEIVDQNVTYLNA